MEISALDHLVIGVETFAAWYVEVLGMKGWSTGLTEIILEQPPVRLSADQPSADWDHEAGMVYGGS